EDGIRDDLVTGVQTCALPIWGMSRAHAGFARRPRKTAPERLRFDGFVGLQAVVRRTAGRVRGSRSSGADDVTGPAKAAPLVGGRSEERSVGKEGSARWTRNDR